MTGNSRLDLAADESPVPTPEGDGALDAIRSPTLPKAAAHVITNNFPWASLENDNARREAVEQLAVLLVRHLPELDGTGITEELRLPLLVATGQEDSWLSTDKGEAILNSWVIGALARSKQNPKLFTPKSARHALGVGLYRSLTKALRKAGKTVLPTRPAVSSHVYVAEAGTDGRPSTEVAVANGRLGLLTTTHHEGQEMTSTSYLLPEALAFHRYTDEEEHPWFETHVGDLAIRGRPSEFVRALADRFALTRFDQRMIAAWLNGLPVDCRVATKLMLRAGYDQTGQPFAAIDPVLVRSSGDHIDMAGLVAKTYRPRSRQEAERRLSMTLMFATTPKHRIVACWIAGVPVVKVLAPGRIAPYLDEREESGAGKTHWARVVLAACWGLCDHPAGDLLGGTQMESSFRWDALGSATNLPVILDEALLPKDTRERLRAGASGLTTTRGRRDLTSTVMRQTAAFLFTTNSSRDESDSSAAERHGDVRRRIRLEFTAEDRTAIAPRVADFTRLSHSFAGGEIDPAGGGAILWKLRELAGDPEAFRRLFDLANDQSIDDKQVVMDVGALLLGWDKVPVLPDEDDVFPAAERFLEALRRDVVRLVAIEGETHYVPWEGHLSQPRKADDRLRGLLRAVDRAGDTVTNNPERVATVFVTAAFLTEHQAEARRSGSSSPFHALPDLRTLAALTGQSPDGIYPEGHGTGFVRKIGGSDRKVAVVRIATPDDPRTAPEPKTREVG